MNKNIRSYKTAFKIKLINFTSSLSNITKINKIYLDKLIWKLLLLFVFYKIITPILTTNAFAQDTDLTHVEQSLPAKKSDIDSVLEQLIDEHDKKQVTLDPKNTSDILENLDRKLAGGLLETQKAEIIILNKITTQSKSIIFNLEEEKSFGNLAIKLHKCIKNTNPLKANHLMFVSVIDNRIDGDNSVIFRSWVMSANPSLATLEHPVYEVIPIGCLP